MSYDNGITFDSLGHTRGQVDYVNVIDRFGNPLAYEVPRWKANWEFKRRYSPAIAAMMDSYDPGDRWASVLEMAFAICVCARAMENPAPAIILSYRPGLGQRDLTIDEISNADSDDEVPFPATELADAIRDGRVTDSDLTFAAKVLHRYLALLDAAGESY